MHAFFTRLSGLGHACEGYRNRCELSRLSFLKRSHARIRLHLSRCLGMSTRWKREQGIDQYSGHFGVSRVSRAHLAENRRVSRHQSIEMRSQLPRNIENDGKVPGTNVSVERRRRVCGRALPRRGDSPRTGVTYVLYCRGRQTPTRIEQRGESSDVAGLRYTSSSMITSMFRDGADRLRSLTSGVLLAEAARTSFARHAGVGQTEVSTYVCGCET